MRWDQICTRQICKVQVSDSGREKLYHNDKSPFSTDQKTSGFCLQWERIQPSDTPPLFLREHANFARQWAERAFHVNGVEHDAPGENKRKANSSPGDRKWVCKPAHNRYYVWFKTGLYHFLLHMISLLSVDVSKPCVLPHTPPLPVSPHSLG